MSVSVSPTRVAEALIDERNDEVMAHIRHDYAEGWKFTWESVLHYMRRAYENGCLDAMHERPPLTEEIPMLAYPELFLP